MATLRREADQTEVRLPCRCVVGRSPMAFVRLPSGCASREHAVIDYRDGGWRLRDLGTRNGTSIAGRLCGDGWRGLATGDRICFGGEEESWVVVDASAPPPAAVRDNGAVLLGDGDLLVLPDGEEPLLSVHADGERWVIDDGDGDVRAVESETPLDVGGERFELLLPTASAATTTPSGAVRLDLDALTAVFEFDRSEEHVRLTLVQGEHRRELPERTFLFMLLLLARARQHEQAVQGASESEAGWMDSQLLADKLKLKPETVNLYVFRARKLFAEHGVGEAGRVVERRPRTQQLRFGVRSLRFVPL